VTSAIVLLLRTMLLKEFPHMKRAHTYTRTHRHTHTHTHSLSLVPPPSTHTQPPEPHSLCLKQAEVHSRMLTPCSCHHSPCSPARVVGKLNAREAAQRPAPHPCHMRVARSEPLSPIIAMISTLHDVLAGFPGTVALRLTEGIIVSRQDLYAAVVETALALQRAGVKPGDVVSMAYANTVSRIAIAMRRCPRTMCRPEPQSRARGEAAHRPM
jgi:hypothetical protein